MQVAPLKVLDLNSGVGCCADEDNLLIGITCSGLLEETAMVVAEFSCLGGMKSKNGPDHHSAEMKWGLK